MSLRGGQPLGIYVRLRFGTSGRARGCFPPGLILPWGTGVPMGCSDLGGFFSSRRSRKRGKQRENHEDNGVVGPSAPRAYKGDLLSFWLGSH